MVFITNFPSPQILSPRNYSGSAKKQIDATGYSWQELARVEYAFESAKKGESADDWMFNGLMAVLDVLADIHGVNLSAKSSYVGQLAEIHGGK